MNHRHDWSDWWVSGYSQTARDKQAVARWKIQRRVCFVCAKSERREVPIVSSRVADAVAAALPKPRIQANPGMVLRSKTDRTTATGPDAPPGTRYLVSTTTDRSAWWVLGPNENIMERLKDVDYGLDPDEWEVILDVD